MNKRILWNLLNTETQDDIIKVRKATDCCVPWEPGGSAWSICPYHYGFDKGVKRMKRDEA